MSSWVFVYIIFKTHLITASGRCHLGQHPKPGVGDTLQHLPHDLMSDAAHIELHPLVHGPGLLDHEGVRIASVAHDVIN